MSNKNMFMCDFRILSGMTKWPTHTFHSLPLAPTENRQKRNCSHLVPSSYSNFCYCSCGPMTIGQVFTINIEKDSFQG